MIAFWIKPSQEVAERGGCRIPLGYGVTGHSLNDALEMLGNAGYDVPPDLAGYAVVRNVTPEEIDEPHVRKSMGPIVVRGIWYPFSRMGPTS